MSQWGLDPLFFSHPKLAIRELVGGEDVWVPAPEGNGAVHLYRGRPVRRCEMMGCVVSLNPKPGKTVFTLDDGTGCVECVVWNRDRVLGRHSLDIGVARLTDWIKPSDPLTAKDLTSLHRVVDAALAPVLNRLPEAAPSLLVGTSGAFNTLAALEDAGAQWHNPREADVLPLETLRSRCMALSRLSKEALRSTPGVHPDRVPYMAIACALIHHLLERFPSIEEVRRSRHTVAEGILVETARGMEDGLGPEWISASAAGMGQD